MARVPLPPKNPNEDQAVFLSYYQAKDRFAFLPTKVIAHAEPKDEHGDDDNAPEGPAAVIVEHHPSQGTPFPSLLDDALQFILNYSDAEVAVTSTTHLHCLLGDGEWPEDMISTLRAFAPDITVNEQTKAGSFSMRHLLIRQYAARATAQPQPHPAHLPAAEPMEVENVDDTNPEAGPSTSPTTSDEKAPENPVPRPGTNGQFIIGKLEGDTFLWPHLLFSEADEAEAGTACHAIFSPDGRSVAAGYDDAVVRVWDVETGVLDHRLEKHELSIVALAFSPDSSKLASGSSDAAVILWELNEDLDIATLQHDEVALWCLAWSPDGEVIATGTIEFTVTLWSTLTYQRIAILPSQASLIQHISFSPDSSHLLSVSQNIASIWDAKTGEAVSQLHGHMNVIWCAAFSPDGNRVVTGGEDSTTRIWDSKTGDALVIIREHTNPVWAVEFSPDGQDVLSGSYDSTISVCNSYTGERRHLLRRQASTVTSATYSPDGAFISSGYADGSVNVWDTKKGRLMAELKGHEDKVKSVQYSRNGRNIVSSSDDGTVRVWSMVDVLKLVHLA
ncbi:WD40 repeat-like protein [Panus rudis PR-1116 ss-1]|nr:WD40 repeat-like protein [Panus rudis PR-1116 ss-1]